MSKAAEMRYMLATVGILLDEPTRAGGPVTRPPVERDEERELIERDRIREALIAAGASADDLGWLTDSCPSLDDALRYTPTRRSS